MLASRRTIFLGFALLVVGCRDEVVTRQCMSMGAGGEIVSAAERLKVDVYGADARCDGAQVAAGSGAPLFSRTFSRGEPIALDVSPGKRTLVLSAYADADATLLLGSGCSTQELAPGSKICIDLMLTQAPDMAAPDAAMPDMAACVGAECPCLINEECPFNQYCGPDRRCVPGCKQNSECAQLASQADLGAPPDGGVPVAGLICNPDRHACVECVGAGDCETGKLCSPGGQCVEGCDPTRGKGCSQASQSCCGNLCVDLRSDVFNCGVCGTTCTGSTSSCCNGSCVDPMSDVNHCGGCGKPCSTAQATPSCGSGQCSFACNAGYAHCMSGNTGCETDLVGTSQKLCGALCIAQSSCCVAGDCTSPPSPGACYTGSCPSVGGACSYGIKTGSKVCSATCCNALNGSCNNDCTLACTSGFADCDGDRANGCETNLAAASKKLCGSVCVASSTCCAAGDCTAKPAPAACYDNSCSGVGGSCSYPLKSDATVCSSTCCRAINGSCSGSCVLSCTAGYANCDGDRATGCEVNLASTSQKLCGAACIAQSSCCVAGDCTSKPSPAACYDASCPTPGGACSYPLKSDATVCGSTCCRAINGTCNGSCVLSCTAGFADCNLNPADGCEVNLSATSQRLCGSTCIAASACCVVGECTSKPTPAACYDASCTPGSACSYPLKSDATVCSTTCCRAINGTCNGSCVLSCAGGFADCNGNPADGCEVNLVATSQKLCGSTCVPVASCCASGECTTPQDPASCYNNPGTCSAVGGSCSYTLKSGSVVCAGTPNVCCNAINGSCNGSCALTCTGGFADCDGDKSNGCETDLAATNKKVCSGQCVSTSTCCVSGDCGSPPSPAACYDGSCSGIGGSCSYPQKAGSQVCSATCCLPINGTCNAGTCTLNCNAGNLDCDGNRTNGCECNTQPCCSACTPSHSNCINSAGFTCSSFGLGQSYTHSVDYCHALGVPGGGEDYTPAMSTDARAAWPATPIATWRLLCPGGGAVEFTPGSGDFYNARCTETSSSCVCWVFGGTFNGYLKYNTVLVGGGPSASRCDVSVSCPSASTFPTWN